MMNEPAKLRRTLTTPLLVFYGIGVTIGAGIFALIGEVLRLAGDQAPLSFLLAGTIAGMTGFSYALLARVFPRAGGEAVFVNNGLGPLAARFAGYGVVVTAIVSSAVISIAFAGYLTVFVQVDPAIIILFLILGLTGIAAVGIVESVIFAAIITLAELSILLIIAGAGAPLLVEQPALLATSFVPTNTGAMSGILSASLLAFFAFIGFEDIENMAEETQNPSQALPRAIFWTLGITIIVYLAISLVAVAAPNRIALLNSDAPMATLFETLTGLDGKPVAAVAAVAMINGVLIQIIMAARVLYGMSNEGLAPSMLGKVNTFTQTPLRATIFVAVIIATLALVFPIGRLAAFTSIITLFVFTMVNLSLALIGRRHKDPLLKRFHLWGYAGAALSIGLIIYNVQAGALVSH